MKKFFLPLFCVAVFMLNVATTCSKKPVENISQFNQVPPMFDNYANYWKTIDSLDRNGLPQSAQTEVEKVYKLAQKEENYPQLIKATIYKSNYINQLEEEGLVKVIRLWQTEIKNAKSPAKQILRSVLAEIVNSYKEQNRYRFYNRTETLQFDNQDISTWSLEQLSTYSADLYWSSLERGSDLKGIKIDNIQPITTQSNVSNLRPTLFDFLAFRAIAYFMNEQNYLTKPAYYFELRDPAAFAYTNEFINTDFPTQDENSYKKKTLELFKNLLEFRTKDEDNKAALVDAELLRLRFVYNNSVLTNKKDLYLSALEKLAGRYENAANAGEIFNAIGNWYLEKGNEYKYDNPDKNGVAYKDAYKMAMQQFKKATENYPNTFGSSAAERQIATLLNTYLEIKTEEVTPIQESIFIRIDYKNITKAYTRLIRWNDNRKKELESIFNSKSKVDEKVIQYLRELPFVRQDEFNLTGTEDYRTHGTEFGLDGVESGKYIILIASESDFSYEKGSVGYTEMSVSDLNFWVRQPNSETGDRSELVVINRKTGEPEANVKATFHSYDWNSSARKQVRKKLGSTTSDVNGFVKINFPFGDRRSNNNYRVTLIKGQDTLSNDNAFYDSKYKQERIITQRLELFTDRGIYRPGQIIYFKGIVLEVDKNQYPRIKTNSSHTLFLYDTNRQKVGELNVRTNEYGTFNGTFTAPQGGLLGRMYIRDDKNIGQKTIRVEEYKRPKFEVKFEPQEQSFALNDSISVQGQAVAYAGNNIDGAKVSYRVFRQASFPYLPWWYSYRGFGNSSAQVEIINGTTKTDEKGQFKLNFKALADESIDPDRKPVFTYSISADITDINGETRTATQHLRVGYIALEATAEINDEVQLESFKEIKIETKNLQGEDITASGSFSLKLLESPDRIFIKRAWNEPDVYSLTQTEYRKHFPNISFKNEENPKNWTIKSTPVQVDFNTAQSRVIKLDNSQLSTGKYIAELSSKDKNGRAVKWTKIFTIQSKNAAEPAIPEILSLHEADKVYEPADKAELIFKTSIDEVYVLFEVEKKQKLVTREWLTINELQNITININEADRGNFAYYVSYAKYNRSFLKSQIVRVPWSNKDLEIEYTSFRDKLLPGQNEEWQIKIKGAKKDKVAAEMLATMYDASLDAFAGNKFSFSPYPSYNYARLALSHTDGRASSYRFLRNDGLVTTESMQKNYPELNLFNFRLRNRTNYSMSESESVIVGSARKLNRSAKNKAFAAPDAPMMMADAAPSEETLEIARTNSTPPPPPNEQEEENTLQIRENLNETVFFYPNLNTDAEGNIIVKFKMNEALTKWKFLALAHTKELEIGISEKEIITQKDLMIIPNPPRFFRENDEIEFTAKVVNLGEKDLSGIANLELINPLTGKPVFVDADFPQEFSVKAGQSTPIVWYFNVPKVSEVPVIQHTVSARAGKFTDAERSITPVLTNRMLVTETLPLPTIGNSEKTFTFKSMLEKSSSKTLDHEGLTLEFTSNPAWYAVQSLPYLMEYPHDCTEQIFSRFYANSLATSVANKYPKVKSIFEQWRDREPDALKSNLSKNQELKTALLEETPWVLNAQSEETQKKNIGLLFDLNRMANEQDIALKKLQDRQMSGGGFPWFPGGRDNWYITQYLVEGLGHLQALGVKEIYSDAKNRAMLQRALKYCDDRVIEYYEKYIGKPLEEEKYEEKDKLNPIIIHYLYARSFFLKNKQAGLNIEIANFPLEKKAEKVFDFFINQAEQYWLDKNIYQQGMLALALHRNENLETTTKMVKSFQERALRNEELGVYFKGASGYNWYELPIERHSLLIEVMDVVAQDADAVEQMKIWLLKNKQTNHWRTTKATASAVYALLATGDNWLVESEPVEVSFPASDKFNQQIKAAQNTAEAGTGYFKTRLHGEEVNNDLSTVKVTNSNKSIAWGAVYWQYFEQMDKITTFEDTPLTIKKQLFKVVLDDTGEKLLPIDAGATLEPGDQVKVRIELRVDRSMDYVHMKDGRASGFEPMNVLSQYKYQGGLGYYETTKDASTDFFFGYLPKGTHVFEYPVRVVHRGDFSNGITTVQCMYAPEFTSHSEGIRVGVE